MAPTLLLFRSAMKIWFFTQAFGKGEWVSPCLPSLTSNLYFFIALFYYSCTLDWSGQVAFFFCEFPNVTKTACICRGIFNCLWLYPASISHIFYSADIPPLVSWYTTDFPSSAPRRLKEKYFQDLDLHNSFNMKLFTVQLIEQ